MNEPFRLGSRLKSFSYAGHGVWLMLRFQHNAWIHCVATVAVLAAGLALRLSRLEWCAAILCCALVWAAEALNTALELLADALKPERHPMVGQAKDAAAGAVLIAALGSAVVGLLVFSPHITAFFGW